MFEAVQGAGDICGPGANYFIEKWFGERVYSSLEICAFCIGLSSVFFWLIAQLPQIINNILRQSAEALSPWFLTQWLAGDSCNLLGCIFTGDQLATQTITAGYFIFADLIILTQYFYYQRRNQRTTVDLYHYDSDEKPCNIHNEVRNTSKHLELDKMDEQNALAKISGDSYVEDEPRVELESSSNLNGNDTCHLEQMLYPFAVSDLKYQNSWIHENGHRLGRLVQEYGLEYREETISQHKSWYSAWHRNLRGNQPIDFRRKSDQLLRPSRNARFKALLGVACLFGLASSKLYVGRNSIQNCMDRNFESVLGRRILWAVPEAAAVSFKDNLSKPSMIVGLNWLSATQTLSQLSLGSCSTCSWTKLIGRSLGYGCFF